MIAHAVENLVITLPAASEILLRVVNDVICAERSDHLYISHTAHAGYFGAKRLGDLHSERTHASGGAVDKNPLPRLNLPLIAKALQCSECGKGGRSRLFKRHVVRLQGQR